MKLCKRLIFSFFIPLLTLSWSIRCFADPPSGWINEGSVTTTHFEIHWEGSSTSSHYATNEWINRVKQYLEDAWNFQTSTWQNPPDPDGIIRVKVWNRDPGAYGATRYVGGNLEIRLDNDYAGFTVSGEDGLKMTISHEFFHCVQLNWVDIATWGNSNNSWFIEGSAEWMADQEYDNINGYIRDGYAKALLDFPGDSLDARTGDAAYGCVLFWLFVNENKNKNINNIFSNFKNQGYTDFLKATAIELGDIDWGGNNSKQIWKDFTVACYVKTGANGFTDDGASLLPDVKIAYSANEQNTDNTHYYKDVPANIGDKMNTSGYQKKLNTVEHIASRYESLKLPAQAGRNAGDNYDKPVKLYAYFNGIEDYSGCMLCKQKQDGTRIFLQEINRGNIVGIDFGGNSGRDEEICLVMSNSHKTDSKTRSYGGEIKKS
ncbi:hypothetical protein KKG61_07395 [bacterium]|nr:hypothetical protein [bacterium]